MKKFILLIMCAGLAACNGTPQSSEAVADYGLIKLQPSNVILESQYSASIRGRQDIDIRPQLSGLIEKVCVTEGEYVRKGQTLFIIDQVAYRAALDMNRADEKMALAEVAIARQNVETKNTLAEEEIISKYELQTARNTLAAKEAQLAQARARVRNAENDLSFTVITSPSDGVVGMLPYKVGALVSPDMSGPLTTISDNSEMYVYFSLTENRALELLEKYGSVSQVTESMPEVRLMLNTGNFYREKGRIRSMSGVIDRRTGSVSIRAVFPNGKGLLLSGASGRIFIPEQRENVLVIPQTATFEIQDKFFVYKALQGKAVSQEVKITPVGDGKSYIVEKGLSSGEVIVTEGVTTLQEGTQVEKQS